MKAHGMEMRSFNFIFVMKWPALLLLFKQLCGFQRIHLKVGETKEITFRLDKKSLALYMQNEEWAVEPGRFTLMLGGSSEQIYQQKEIEITKKIYF